MKYRAIFFKSLAIDKDYVVINGMFSRAKIPYNAIASVEKSLIRGILIETTGGKNYNLTLWNRSKENEAIDLILSFFRENKKDVQFLAGEARKGGLCDRA